MRRWRDVISEARQHVPAHTRPPQAGQLISTWWILVTALGKSTTMSSYYSELPTFSTTNYVSLRFVLTLVMEMLSALVVILGTMSSLTLGDSDTGWTNWPAARTYLTKYGYNTEDKSLDIK